MALVEAQKDPPASALDAVEQRCKQLPDGLSERPYFLSKLSLVRCNQVNGCVLVDGSLTFFHVFQALAARRLPEAVRFCLLACDTVSELHGQQSTVSLLLEAAHMQKKVRPFVVASQLLTCS
jgi:hypothetical protein